MTRGYDKRVLAQIVDPDAAAAAHKAGVGATIDVDLGGHFDRNALHPDAGARAGAAPVGWSVAAGDDEDAARVPGRPRC